MKNIFRLLAVVLVSAGASASEFRDLSSEELASLNFLLQCPKELAEVMQKAEWIGSGTSFSDRPGVARTYLFAARKGFTGSESVATLTVKRLRNDNPAADAPGFSVECKLDYDVSR